MTFSVKKKQNTKKNTGKIEKKLEMSEKREPWSYVPLTQRRRNGVSLNWTGIQWIQQIKGFW